MSVLTEIMVSLRTVSLRISVYLVETNKLNTHLFYLFLLSGI